MQIFKDYKTPNAILWKATSSRICSAINPPAPTYPNSTQSASAPSNDTRSSSLKRGRLAGAQAIGFCGIEQSGDWWREIGARSKSGIDSHPKSLCTSKADHPWIFPSNTELTCQYTVWRHHEERWGRKLTKLYSLKARDQPWHHNKALMTVDAH